MLTPLKGAGRTLPLFWLIPLRLISCLFLPGPGLSGEAQWSIGVYMCADNSMSAQAYQDIAEMMAVGSSDKVHVVVQVDFAASDTNPTCRRYYIQKDKMELLANLGEVDMADTATLADFIKFLATHIPAKRYFLILWNHGTGWRAGYGPSRAVLLDESHSHMMGVAGGELARALNRGTKRLGKKLTLIGFDACLMGSIETAFEVMPYANYLLASSGLVPWEGLPYDELLNRLVKNPEIPVEDFLQGVCNDYLARYPDEDLCLAGVSLSELNRSINTIRSGIEGIKTWAFWQDKVKWTRARVQTFPEVVGNPPAPNAEQIDFMHFWQLLESNFNFSLNLSRVVVALANRGSYRSAKGLSCWFPYFYLSFKAKANEYHKLAFSDSLPWLKFLNDYFQRDDVKPTPPELLNHKLGGRNDLRLWWSRSYDCSNVFYELYQATAPEVIFLDPGETFGFWEQAGWTVSTRYFHSSPTAFFSGSAANLNSQLLLKQPLNLPFGGLLSFYAYYNTEESQDSTGEVLRDVCYLEISSDARSWQALDSLYGEQENWESHRYLLPAGVLYIRFRYCTNGAVNRLGVFIDDIQVTMFAWRRRALATSETTAYLFNLPRDTSGYYFFLRAIDSFGNSSFLSQLYEVKVNTWAEPYTQPAPFYKSCKLVLDFPEGEEPDVSIYTLSGTLVKKFNKTKERILKWDGSNEKGQELASGIYIVVVHGKSFKKMGKIAKVRKV